MKNTVAQNFFELSMLENKTEELTKKRSQIAQQLAAQLESGAPYSPQLKTELECIDDRVKNNIERMQNIVK